MLPVWHNMLGVAFFGANIVAGILLLERRKGGIGLSLFVQLLQVVFFNGSFAWIARAGLHVTPIIASTGAAVYAGPAFEFFSYHTNAVAFSAKNGLGFQVFLDFLSTPLAEARFALGVNFVAAYFALRLWNILGRVPEHPASELNLRGIRRWSLPATYTFVGVLIFFMAMSGPKTVNPPHERWLAGTGDTLEILNYMLQYDATVNTANPSVSTERSLVVQFNSDFSDSARDHANAIALAQMTCHVADSIGVKRTVISPTKQVWFLLRLTRNYSFRVDTASHCSKTWMLKS